MQESDEHIRYEEWVNWSKDDRDPLVKPERRKAKNVVAIDGERGGRQYRSLTDPLDYYVTRGSITQKQYAAGQRLGSLWRKAAGSLYTQSRYAEGSGGEPELQFVPIGAFAVAYRKATDAIRDPRARGLTILVCCHGMPASRCVEASPRTARRHGIMLLADGLYDLDKYFSETRK